ncbi:hypothetical protein [Kyrpidia spormannii]|uniref:Uncharacterized protein n=1 Tax=Kyrpidia spormannii TaxID=2055160 RepID=A0A6F9E7I9_9BACL|nr:hypothetical protein [Kyrpidia spormannii]CAB3392251.1 conserved exported protein of unknown function [Kyrpidia spormannii]
MKSVLATFLLGLVILMAGHPSDNSAPGPSPSKNLDAPGRIVRQLNDPQQVLAFLQDRGITLPYVRSKPISVTTVVTDPLSLIPAESGARITPPMIPPMPVGNPYLSIEYEVQPWSRTGQEMLSSVSGPGPMRIGTGVSETIQSGFSTSVPVSSTLLSKSLGWNVGTGYPVVGEFSTDVPPETQLNLATYPEYTIYRLTIWRVPLTGTPYVVGSGEAWRPVGFTIVTFTL